MAAANRFRQIANLALLAGALTAPFVVSGFTLFQLSQAICYGMGVMGLKLLSGYNGQFSLGHSIFFAAGAYTTAILTANGNDFYLALPIAAVVAFGFGIALGWPALRVRGHQLAVVTLVFALAVPQILRSSALTDLTGGPAGIGFAAPVVPIAGWTADEWWYALTLTIALSVTAFMIVLVRSRLGRSLQAMRDNATAASACGINAAFTNTLTFGLSASIAGLAGALMMGPLAYVSPESYPGFLGLSLFVALIVTGPKWIGGAYLGGLMIVFMPNWAESVSMGIGNSQALTFAMYGVALLLGIYSQVFDIGRLWRRMVKHRSAPVAGLGQ